MTHDVFRCNTGVCIILLWDLSLKFRVTIVMIIEMVVMKLDCRMDVYIHDGMVFIIILLEIL